VIEIEPGLFNLEYLNELYNVLLHDQLLSRVTSKNCKKPNSTAKPVK
jgi:hypothetical protein